MNRLFLDKNLVYYVIMGVVFNLIIILYFWELTIKKYSYLQLTSAGNVYRVVNYQYLYQNNLFNLTLAIGGFLVLLLILIYLLVIRNYKSSAISIQDTPEITEDLSLENEVFYGKGTISTAALKSFVRMHPESAVKFIFEKSIDGSALDPLIKKLHRDWIIRGMNQANVKDEILSLLGLTVVPKLNLYELTIDLRNSVEDEKLRFSSNEVNNIELTKNNFNLNNI